MAFQLVVETVGTVGMMALLIAKFTWDTAKAFL